MKTQMMKVLNESKQELNILKAEMEECKNDLMSYIVLLEIYDNKLRDYEYLLDLFHKTFTEEEGEC